MNPLKKIAHLLLGDYELYLIYESQPPASAPLLPAGFEFGEISSANELESAAPEMSSLAPYLLEDVRCFVIRKEGQIVSACVYWWGLTYTRQRNFWSLRADDAKLVQINTVPSCRKLGLGSALILHSTLRMTEEGFARLFARIWHSNAASVRAFERAGWKKVAFRGRFRIPLIGVKTVTRYYER